MTSHGNTYKTSCSKYKINYVEMPREKFHFSS